MELDFDLHADGYGLAVFACGREEPLFHRRHHGGVDIVIEAADHTGVSRGAVRADDGLDQDRTFDAEPAAAGRILRVDLAGYAGRCDIAGERVNRLVVIGVLVLVFRAMQIHRRGEQRDEQKSQALLQSCFGARGDTGSSRRGLRRERREVGYVGALCGEAAEAGGVPLQSRHARI